MSTVLLMTDSWQPTVLRLVPFSNNNARNADQSLNLGKPLSDRATVHKRGFPVLAVTRVKGSGQSDNRSISSRSVTSARSEVTEKDNASVVSGSTVKSNMTIRPDGGHSSMKSSKAAAADRMKGAQTPSDKESLKFSVQNLNEQVSSSSSLKSNESKRESKQKDKSNSLDNTRTKFLKPVLSASSDVVNVSPVNGVRRSVPLTPGELDLKRFRDTYNQEQAQRKKKYKLNVNQLPRSTTPINDHDPDKLNMKQVIAFLQTKATKDVQKKPQSDRVPSGHKGNRASLEMSVTPSRRTAAVVDERSSSQQSKLSSRESNRKAGAVSVLSTKSTPNLPYAKSVPKTKSSLSTRSNVSRNRVKRTGSFKPMKEFRLYRFLAVVPNGRNNAGLMTTMADAGDIVAKDDFTAGMTVQGNQTHRSPRNPPEKQTRHQTTANLLHRRARKKNTNGDIKKDIAESENSTLIRLPNVTDFRDDQEELSQSEDETTSTTSATCNSTNLGNFENVGQTKKGRITFSDDIQYAGHNKQEPFHADDNCDDEPQKTVHSSAFPGINPRMYKSPEFPRVNIQIPNNSQKHIHVNIPRQEIKQSVSLADGKQTYSSEIVRLTLRQDKNATRVTSYMSDIQNTDSGDVIDNADHSTSVTSMLSSQSFGSHKDVDTVTWLETPKHLLNGLSHINNRLPGKQKKKCDIYNNE